MEAARIRSVVRAVGARRTWLGFGLVAYAAALALREGGGARVVVLCLAALLLAAVSARHTSLPTHARLVGVGAALVLLGATPGSIKPALHFFSELGAALAFAGAWRAIPTISGPPSLHARPQHAPRWLAMAMFAGWAWALAGWGARSFGFSGALADGAERASLAIALTSLSLVALVGAYVAAQRRLELGVPIRAGLVGFFSATAGFAAALLLAFGGEHVHRELRGLTAGAMLLVTAVVGSGDPVDLARLVRRIGVLVLTIAPVVVLGSLAMAQSHAVEGLVATMVAVVALVSAAPALEQPFLPGQGELLRAVERAHLALRRAEVDVAMSAALWELWREPRVRPPSPRLYVFDPPRMFGVDAAGYLTDHVGSLPEGLVQVASQEPEATLRRETLEALEVRRADLRPLARWMAQAELGSATLVTRGGEVEAVLVLPRASQERPLTLEEVRALKQLADSLAGVSGSRAALLRSLQREQRERERAESEADRAARAAHEIERIVARNERVTERLARPASVGMYAPASRLAFEALERRVEAGAPVAVLAPPGVDVVAILARAHLGGPRRAAPFVVVDATAHVEHDTTRWLDRNRSPLGLVRGGLLVLADVGALPLELQNLVATALVERRLPWEEPEAIEFQIAVSATRPLTSLLEEGKLHPRLAARLGDALSGPVALPALAERPEDLRALLLDGLAREGLRQRGVALGLDDGALAMFLEHPFAGGDAELTSLVRQLALRVDGTLVQPEDVRAVLRGTVEPGGAQGSMHEPTPLQSDIRELKPRKRAAKAVASVSGVEAGPPSGAAGQASARRPRRRSS